MENNGIIPGFDNDKDDSLTISLRKAEGVPHGMFIYLSGYIDTYNSSFFQKQIQKVMDAGFINLIFNCSSPPFGFTTLRNTVKEPIPVEET